MEVSTERTRKSQSNQHKQCMSYISRSIIATILGAPEFMGEQMDNEELNLSLSLQPSYPSRFLTGFSCCYCPKRFQSSRALGGHQNAHKLERNLAKRNREAFLAISQRKGANAGIKHGSSALSGESTCKISSGKKHHEEAWQVMQGSSGSSSSGTVMHKSIDRV